MNYFVTILLLYSIIDKYIVIKWFNFIYCICKNEDFVTIAGFIKYQLQIIYFSTIY